jgi:sugar O-acyltransferase (sialic acid O-acetyltransferase NeuD family)
MVNRWRIFGTLGENMKNIVIVGAGGFGREIACWLEATVLGADTRLAGFLDDTIQACERLEERYPYPVLGSIAAYVPAKEDAFIIAIGDPSAKLAIAASLEKKGAVFFNFIHPTAMVARTASLGKGIIMFPGSVASANSVISDFVTINSYAGAGHDAIVGKGTTISAHVDITANVKIGESVFIGSHASILPNVEVENHARIGAGSVVVKRVKQGSTVYAAPARSL